MRHHDPPDNGSARPRQGADVVPELEKQLRTAFRAMASEIPAPAPPLERQPRDPHGPGGAWTPGRIRWLPAVAAAVAVLAIVASALVAADVLAGRQTPPVGPIQTTVPRYYVALIASQPFPQHVGTATVATVRATSTGAVIASVRAPRPYSFATVTAAADDRSFVLLAVGPFRKATSPPGMYAGRTYAQRFFALRIHPSARTPSARAQLTALPAADIASGLQVQAIALSPSGQSLAAILSDASKAIGTVIPERLTVFNLDDGSQQTWTRTVCAYGQCAQGPIGDGQPIIDDPGRIQLSWTSDGRSVLFITGPTGSQVRLLDVDTGGGNLTADSRVLPIRTAIQIWNEALITPDGKSVFIQYGSLTGSAERGNLLRFSAMTGKATVVNQALTYLGGEATGAGPDYVLWTSDDGSKFIVFGARPGTIKGSPGQSAAVPSGQTAGIYSGGRYRPLPWPAGVVDAAW